MRLTVVALALVAAAGLALAGDPDTQPRPVPLTRPEMKRLLEDMKHRKERIPLPELTEEEKKADERGRGYESRLRSLYLKDIGSGFGSVGPRPMGGGNTPAANPGAPRGGRDQEPNMSLDYRFKVELFWLVSRANNCQY